MKSLLLVLLISSLAVLTVQAQQTERILLQGNRVENRGATTRIRGNATVTTDGFELRANEVDFNSTTRSLEARGRVALRSIGALSPAERALLASKEMELARLLVIYSREFSAVKSVQAEIAVLQTRSKNSDWSIETDSLKMVLPPAAALQIRYF
jgi:lipopolysaccharide assembly outer membrane protein LptD (OstA)